MDVAAEVERWRSLLRLERDEEARRGAERLANRPLVDLEADGELVRHLHVQDEGPGPTGLWAVTLARADKGMLPRLSFGAGEPVALGGAELVARRAFGDGVPGVVDRVDGRTLRVLVDARAWEDAPEEPLAAWPVSSSATMDRMEGALSRALDLKGDARKLAEILLGAATVPPTRGSTSPPGDAGHLNDEQRAAVALADMLPLVSLVHGPPGTGKTTTAGVIAAHALARGERVLLCAPSNTGADELARALARLGGGVVRVGHPARVDPSLHPILLGTQVREHPLYRLGADLVRQAENLRTRSNSSRRSGAEARALRDERRAEWRGLVRDARKLFQQAEDEVLRRTRAVACTLAGSAAPPVSGLEFDVAIVDEASQALLPLVLVPLGRVGRIVLVGDHHQLPPTILSPRAVRGGLGRTAFDLLADTGAAPAVMLEVQHRMHRDLCAFPSARHYGGRLRPHPDVAGRTLASVLGERAGPLGGPLMFVDTAGTGFSDELPQGSSSHRNPGEARAVLHLVHRLVDAGLPPGDIGVITPYRAQAEALSVAAAALCEQGLEVDSVDAFQGREKEAVIVSLVRSNESGESGFVDDPRRLNVALTRARSWLRVVGDSGTVGARGDGAALVEHALGTGAHGSAWTLEGFDVAGE